MPYKNTSDLCYLLWQLATAGLSDEGRPREAFGSGHTGLHTNHGRSKDKLDDDYWDLRSKSNRRETLWLRLLLLWLGDLEIPSLMTFPCLKTNCWWAATAPQSQLRALYCFYYMSSRSFPLPPMSYVTIQALLTTKPNPAATVTHGKQIL